MFGPEFMERCPAQAAQEKPQLLIFLRPKDISDYITMYHNAKPLFIENKTKVTFLVELNTELLMTKYEKDLVKSLIFKKHPDSGWPIVMKSDRVLSLLYDLLQYWHPPFLRSSPLADRRLKGLPPGQQYSTMNTWIEDQCIYALTLGKGSHNLIPFNNTYRTVLSRLYLNRLVLYNWEVYVRDSLANMTIIFVRM